MSGRGTGHWSYRVSAIGCLCATSTRDGVDLLQRTIPQTSRPYYLHVRYHYAIHWYSQAMASDSHLAVAVAVDLTVGSLRDCDNRARVWDASLHECQFGTRDATTILRPLYYSQVHANEPSLPDDRVIHCAQPVPEGCWKLGMNIWITDSNLQHLCI